VCDSDSLDGDWTKVDVAAETKPKKQVAKAKLSDEEISQMRKALEKEVAEGLCGTSKKAQIKWLNFTQDLTKADIAKVLNVNYAYVFMTLSEQTAKTPTEQEVE
jgi:hypothetical protein